MTMDALNSYLVTVHYVDARGAHTMPYKVRARTWGEAKREGLDKFQQHVDFNRSSGYYDFPDLEVKSARPRFLGCGETD